jgi:hypothetical protein
MGLREFNNKYKDYLEKGHYGLAIDIPAVIEYLDKEFQELIKIPGFQYSQIKTKFHWVCFYCDNVPDEKIREITDNIETLI